MDVNEAQEIINAYMDDLFRGIVTSANPMVATNVYVKKKRLSHRFRKILELEHIPEEVKEKMIDEMIAVLPKVTTKEAYIKAQKNILEILSKYLADKFKELENLTRYLKPQEIKNAQRIIQRKQKHILESMRETFAEMILDNPTEELIVIDQALALAIKLYNAMLKNPEDIEKSLFLLVILLRIIGISKGVFDYKILYEDLAEITAELDTELEVPIPIIELLSA
jgi:hypothetical protein